MNCPSAATSTPSTPAAAVAPPPTPTAYGAAARRRCPGANPSSCWRIHSVLQSVFMTTISLRTDPEIGQALADLAPIGNRSQILRTALLHLADDRRRAALRALAEKLAADPQDRAEVQAVLADMEHLRAW